jgi:hypothetical protein
MTPSLNSIEHARGLRGYRRNYLLELRGEKERAFALFARALEN